MNSIQMFLKSRVLLAGFLWLVATLFPTLAFTQSVPIPVNTPLTLTGDITPGMTRLDIPFTVSGADGLALDVIAPVNGVTFALIGPSGNTVVTTGDPRLSYNPGSALTPPLPGGVFVMQEVAAPLDGGWTIRLTFPAATGNTIALATIQARSRYQVGIVIDRTTYLVGEDVGVGIIVLDNGRPITGLSPTIGIGLGAPGAAQPAADNGIGPDGLANDGVYSVDYTFSAAGNYQILGTVTIPTPNGNITRTAAATVDAVSPALKVTNVLLTKVLGPNSCVSALKVDLTINAFRAGTFATRVQLSANGKSIDARKSQSLVVGANTISVQFSANDIKQKIASNGPYSVSLIETLEITPTEFNLAFRLANAGAFAVQLSELCTAAIEVEERLTVTPVLKQGFIGSLDFSFPVRVRNAGSYQISFKVIGPAGEDLGLFNASRTLPAGLTQVTTNVPSPLYLKTDGAYKVISLLVVGGGSSARIATVGQSGPYSRWQFYPRITGDLNNDGAVDANDEAVAAQFRGVKALIPGDRRDINKDGVIDIRDVRELQKLKCAVGACPINP
jgi:hypothetical protein